MFSYFDWVYFQLIYTHLCLDQPKDVAKTCSKIIQELTGEKITDLISTSFYVSKFLIIKKIQSYIKL